MTALNGYINDKAYLAFFDASQVHYVKGSHVSLEKPDSDAPSIKFAFKPTAAGKYLFDVTASSGIGGLPVTYNARIVTEKSSSETNFSATIPDEIGHLTFIYDAKTAGEWITVLINANSSWTFYSCEISQIK